MQAVSLSGKRKDTGESSAWQNAWYNLDKTTLQ